jgi:oligoendopeptidase F
MFTSFPTSALTALDWGWADYEPFARELAQRPLNADTVEQWLLDWSQLGRLLQEVANRTEVGVTLDTTDRAAERRYNHFLDEVFPRAQAANQVLKERLLASGLAPAGFEIPLRNMREETALFREQNLPLLSEEQKLVSEYSRIVGAQTVEWEGQEITPHQLQPVLQETDRSRREQAWWLTMARFLADRPALNELWVRLMRLRRELARNAGEPDYRAYRWRQMLRFDYTPADCRVFQRAIEDVAVPAATRIYERRRRRLGLATLRPWDLDVDPRGGPALRPFSAIAELEERGTSIFTQVDPELGRYFGAMRGNRLLDLANRKGKAPGAYCADFLLERRPFIFMNAVGVHDDVQTLLHEGGHAFHVFEAAHLPYVQQLEVGLEFAEVASMSMELLAAPFLTAERGGFYSAADARRAIVQHLESMILFWPYMAVVDAFQHWVYENHAAALEPAACDATWDTLWRRFQPAVDWSGLDAARVTGWHRKLHIFQVPLYYVEYGLAQLGAAQVWRNSLRDPEGAIAAYRRALALGGTVALPSLYAAAGARFAFDADTLGEAVRQLEGTIGALDG